MNKQIEALAKESGMVMYPTGLGIRENTLWGDRNIENFAKAVALQCCSIILAGERNTGSTSILNAISAEFGLSDY